MLLDGRLRENLNNGHRGGKSLLNVSPWPLPWAHVLNVTYQGNNNIKAFNMLQVSFRLFHAPTCTTSSGHLMQNMYDGTTLWKVW